LLTVNQIIIKAKGHDQLL